MCCGENLKNKSESRIVGTVYQLYSRQEQTRRNSKQSAIICFPISNIVTNTK